MRKVNTSATEKIFSSGVFFGIQFFINRCTRFKIRCTYKYYINIRENPINELALKGETNEESNRRENTTMEEKTSFGGSAGTVQQQ